LGEEPVFENPRGITGVQKGFIRRKRAPPDKT
jgi:hypothetical protein